MSAKKESGSGFQGIMSGVLGGALFLSALFLTNEVIPSILIGFGGYIAGLFLFQPNNSLKVVVSGITNEMLDEAVKLGQSQVAQIKTLATSIVNPEVKKEALGIAQKYQAIIDDIRKDPKDLKTARSFLSYYPDAVIKILQRYTDIQSRDVSDINIQNSLKKAEDMLRTIRKAFEKQLAQLLQDDVMDLDTELELLRRTMQSEGLGE